MADISKISVEGTVYDIKDETARTQIGEISTVLDALNGEEV